jgi:outer membrane protein
MPKGNLLLILWNLVLTGLVAWLALKPKPDSAIAATAPGESDPAPQVIAMARDSGALKEARIAHFHMDSLRRKYDLIAERNKRFNSEASRLESGLQKKQDEARQRYQELMSKDQTYSTKAEMERDETELRELMAKLQQMQSEGEERMARMEAEMLTEISKELEEYLAAYNATAGFDYILSIQGGGQIWVGNQGLDITEDLVNGLNARHRAGKSSKK